ncbi:MAG: cytochrome P460 family protein [Granulosicoccus sp.]|nr:cytochrome P460 family protein [Granulosicoccus sp.]
MKFTNSLILATISAVGMVPLQADTGKVTLPENYGSRFVRYFSVDKPNADEPDKTKMRFFYVNPESLAAAEAGQPLPHGTVLIMEDHAVERDAEGNALLDASGRLIPAATITNIFVQEKRSGWGTEYAAEVRNGEWEYAWFDAQGKRREDKSMDGCFSCHKGAEATDFNFTFSPFVAAIKQ